MQITKAFIAYCKDRIGNSTRYLINGVEEDNYFISEWKLMVPKGIFEVTDYKKTDYKKANKIF